MKKIYLVFLFAYILYSCGDDGSINASEQIETQESIESEKNIEHQVWKKTFSAELSFLVNAKINIPTNKCDCDQTRLAVLKKWQKDKNHSFKNKIFSIFSKICKGLPGTENCEFAQKLKEKREELTIIRGQAR